MCDLTGLSVGLFHHFSVPHVLHGLSTVDGEPSAVQTASERELALHSACEVRSG